MNDCLLNLFVFCTSIIKNRQLDCKSIRSEVLWQVVRLREKLMNFLEYNKDEKLSFNYKKSCGLWLIVVALIIFAATGINQRPHDFF